MNKLISFIIAIFLFSLLVEANKDLYAIRKQVYSKDSERKEPDAIRGILKKLVEMYSNLDDPSLKQFEEIDRKNLDLSEIKDTKCDRAAFEKFNELIENKSISPNLIAYSKHFRKEQYNLCEPLLVQELTAMDKSDRDKELIKSFWRNLVLHEQNGLNHEYMEEGLFAILDIRTNGLGKTGRPDTSEMRLKFHKEIQQINNDFCNQIESKSNPTNEVYGKFFMNQQSAGSSSGRKNNHELMFCRMIAIEICMSDHAEKSYEEWIRRVNPEFWAQRKRDLQDLNRFSLQRKLNELDSTRALKFLKESFSIYENVVDEESKPARIFLEQSLDVSVINDKKCEVDEFIKAANLRARYAGPVQDNSYFNHYLSKQVIFCESLHEKEFNSVSEDSVNYLNKLREKANAANICQDKSNEFDRKFDRAIAGYIGATNELPSGLLTSKNKVYNKLIEKPCTEIKDKIGSQLELLKFIANDSYLVKALSKHSSDWVNNYELCELLSEGSKSSQVARIASKSSSRYLKSVKGQECFTRKEPTGGSSWFSSGGSSSGGGGPSVMAFAAANM